MCNKIIIFVGFSMWNTIVLTHYYKLHGEKLLYKYTMQIYIIIDG